MTAKLHLLCHGATAATRGAIFAGPDEPIEDREQARISVLAARLPRFDAVLVAPVLAARQTAAGLGLDAASEQQLADLDVGRWRGRTLADVFAHEPDAASAWLADPAAAPHGGETVMALLERAGAWLAAQDRRGRQLAVAPSAVVRALAVIVLGAPAQAFWTLDAAPLSTIALTHDGRRWRLRFPQA